MAKKYCGKVKVGSSIYKIFKKSGLVTEDGTGALGKARHLEGRILLSKGYNIARTYKVFWHELIHCIECERGLDLEEREVDQVALGLVELLQDNPQLLEMIKQRRFIEESKFSDEVLGRLIKDFYPPPPVPQTKAEQEVTSALEEIVNGKKDKVDKK